MLPPSKERPRGGPGKPLGGCRVRPPQQSRRVLAQRNQSVVPVGVWVESGPGQPEESLAFASALRVEEELKEQEREKAESLRRFQGEVKQRVNQQARMRRKQQLQKSYEAAERESVAAMQYSDSALHWTPRKNTCVFRSHPAPAICVPAQRHGLQNEPFQQQANKLSKTMKQVRRRLASCKTLPQGAGPPDSDRRNPASCETPGEDEGEELLLAGHHDLPAELQNPGTAPRRAERDDFYIKIEFPKNAESCETPEEDEGEELLLAGHHGLPSELQNPGTAPRPAERDGGFYVKIEFPKLRDGSVKDSSFPGPPRCPHACPRAPSGLWAGVDQEETKKQRQKEYLRFRHLFMTMERERVKEQQRQKETEKRIARIKSAKEKQRRVEERRMQEAAERHEASSLGERTREILAQLDLEERRGKKNQENQQRNKEHARYIEALRAQMREKIRLENIDLPPLCSCGSDFWDSHPDTCANNCVFYKNHRAYSQALRSLLSSCDPAGGSPSARPRLRGLAALCARSGTRL